VLGEVVKDVEGRDALVDDVDVVRECMGIKHRADEGDITRVIVNDDDGLRWGRGRLLHYEHPLYALSTSAMQGTGAR
jgi:hypothetical protein